MILPMDITPEQVLFFAKSGVQQAQIRKLKRGQIPIESELDLHGFTAAEAQPLFLSFLESSIAQHHRCVCIIHGKGRTSQNNIPVLKNLVNDWLKQHPRVLAFCSAKPSDGGAGAVYVLLKS